MKRPLQILLSGAVALIAIQSSQAVTMLTPGSGWQRLQWNNSGSPGQAMGGIDAGGRVLAWPVADTFRGTPADNDLFAFAVPAGYTGWVDVADIEANDDGYSILDFDNSFASVGSAFGQGDDLTSTVDDPATTFDASPTSSWASGSFEVLDSGAGGTFQFKVQRVVGSEFDSGGVFVQVRTEIIPEPSSSMLMLLGLAGLVARRRRA